MKAAPYGICSCCGRHLRRKGHYCGNPCKTSAVLTASDHRKLAKREHYLELARQGIRLPQPSPTPTE